MNPQRIVKTIETSIDALVGQFISAYPLDDRLQRKLQQIKNLAVELVLEVLNENDRLASVK